MKKSTESLTTTTQQMNQSRISISILLCFMLWELAIHEAFRIYFKRKGVKKNRE